MRRHYITIATPLGEDGKGGIDRIMDGLRVAFAKNSPVDIAVSFGVTRGPGSIIMSPLYLLCFIGEIILRRWQNRLDLLHINIASRGSTYRKLIIAGTARLLGIPYVLHLHGARYRDFWRNSPGPVKKAIKKMFSRAARIVVLGIVWRDFVANQVPEAKNRIVILPNATPNPMMQHLGGGDSVVILFLGQIGERKGIKQLIEAFAQMSHLPGWRAIVAGDGDVEIARRQIASLALEGRVQLSGWVGAREVEELISKADILTLPSFDENLPMSVIEGMAAGLAVVATPVGAVEDIIKDGETGLLVPVGDSTALAEALTRLVEDTTLRRQLGEAAAEFHKQHLEMTDYAQRLCRLWREALQ